MASITAAASASVHIPASLSFGAKPASSSFTSRVSLPCKAGSLRFTVFSSFPGNEAYTTTTATSQEAKVEGEILSGEWPENVSILNYEDLCKYYEPVIFKEEAQPHAVLADVMSKKIFTATAEQLLEEVDNHFLTISGLPVVNKELKCIGVLSKKDRAKASKGLQSPVGEVMTSPPITLSADKTVNDAAILMLKNKIHRIPIVNESNQVVGIVTRTDIFKALEGES